MPDIKHLLMFICLSLCFACNRDNSEEFVVISTEPDKPQITTNGSLFGIILDQNLEALSGVRINTSDHFFLSDENGTFELIDQKFYQQGLLIEAKKDGYFTTKKLIQSTGNTFDNITLVLIEKENPSTFESSNSELITLSDGSTLMIPANGFQDVDGNEYVGVINIFTKWIHHGDENYIESFPGNYTALNNNQKQVGLVSEGFLIIEISSPEGQLLELKPGLEIELVVPKSQYLQDSDSELAAFAWSNAVQKWVEEANYEINQNSVSVKINKSVEVCIATQFDQVHIEGKLINNSNGITLNTSSLQISITNQDGLIVAHDKTDNEGNFAGLIPINENLQVNVYDACDEIARTFPLDGRFEDSNIGELDLNMENEYYTIVGSLFDCLGFSVRNAFIKINSGKNVDFFRLDETEDFKIHLISCFEQGIDISIFDIDNKVELNYSFSSEEKYISLDNLILCDQDITNYITLLVGDDIFKYNNAKVDVDAINGDIIVGIPFENNPSNLQFLMRIPSGEGTYYDTEFIQLLSLDNTPNNSSSKDPLFYGAVCVDDDVKCFTTLNISYKDERSIQGNLIGDIDFEVSYPGNIIESESINVSCTFSLVF